MKKFISPVTVTAAIGSIIALLAASREKKPLQTPRAAESIAPHKRQCGANKFQFFCKTIKRKQNFNIWVLQ